MTRVRTAAIYVRISDDKADDAAGVGRQERDCRGLAERQGWHVGEVYVENDTSAYKRRKVRLPDGSTALRVVRPAFRQLLDDLAAGTVDAFVAYDLDRVARDPRDLEDLIDVVQASKIPTAAVTGDVNLSTSDGVFMARMLVNVANKSSADTARRVVRKQLELAEQGKHKGGGIRSFGYEADGMTVREPEADALRLIADLILDGVSLSEVARRLNDNGVPTVRGGAWQNRSVHSVITKPRIAGLRVHRGEVVGKAVWPAVLDREQWEKVCLTLAGRAGGGTKEMSRWLSGVLRCSKCGHGLTGSQQGGGRGPRYWCATTRGGCGGIGIDAVKSEDHLEKVLLAYLSRPDVLAELRSATSSTSAERARKEARDDEEQLKELAGLWAARAVTTAEYMHARRDIEERLSRSRSLLQASLPGAVRELLAGDVVGRWDSYVPKQRQEVAKVVFRHGVEVKPAGPQRVFDAQRLVPIRQEAD